MDEQALNWRDPHSDKGPTPNEVTGIIGGNGWYSDANGHLVQIVLRPGALTKGKVPQAYPLLSAWSGHVLANACGLTCTTHWIGLGETLTLAPLGPDQARDLLRRWLAAYRSAWAEPIALPGRTKKRTPPNARKKRMPTPDPISWDPSKTRAKPNACRWP